MKTRPMIALFFSLIYFILMVSFPLQIMSTLDTAFLESFSYLTSLNYALMLIFALTSILVFNINRNIQYLIPVSALLVMINNYFVALWNEAINIQAAQLATAGYLALCLLSFHPVIRRFIKSPQKRWWLTPKRKLISFPVTIILPDSTQLTSTTVDLSKTGMFIKSGHLSILRKFKECIIKLDVGFATLIFKSEIIRTAKATQTHPSGVGVRYKDISINNRYLLSQFL